MLDDQADTDGGGEVHDGMSVGAELSDESCIEHASLDQLETSAPAQLVQVVERSCGEVVESTDLVAFVQQTPRYETSHQPGGTGWENHGAKVVVSRQSLANQFPND